MLGVCTEKMIETRMWTMAQALMKGMDDKNKQAEKDAKATEAKEEKEEKSTSEEVEEEPMAKNGQQEVEENIVDLSKEEL